MLFSDYPTNSFGFQEFATTNLLQIIDLHSTVIYYLILLAIVVIWFFFSSLFLSDHKSFLTHNNNIELFWTILPSLILFFIGLPSLRLLYFLDELLDPQLTLKAIGNQWYWSYEFSDYNESIEFDSFMIQEEDLLDGQFRQLTVDNNLILPINTSIRLLVTANDVLHSFAVPSLGIKADCIPGRLNSLGFIILRSGLFFGQCSELCGSLHASMPIVIHSIMPNIMPWSIHI